LIPLCIELLNPQSEVVFTAAIDCLEEIISKAPYAGETSNRLVTEPFLLWLDARGTHIIQLAIQNGFVDECCKAICDMLCTLGDHSSQYFAQNVISSEVVTVPPYQPKERGYLIQLYVKTMLDFTGFPGYFGLDEEISDMTADFWLTFQDEIWSSGSTTGGDPERRNQVVKDIYVQLVKILRRKVTFPKDEEWSKGSICHLGFS
jgi:hypothetical protein